MKRKHFAMIAAIVLVLLTGLIVYLRLQAWDVGNADFYRNLWRLVKQTASG